MISRFKKMPYMRKVMAVVILVLAVTLSISTIQQTHVTLEVMKEDAQGNVSLLTEQVLINMEEVKTKLEKEIYTKMDSLDLAHFLQEHDQAPGIVVRQRLQYSLNQMITNTSVYDFVLVESKLGKQFCATRASNGFQGEQTAQQLLEDYPDRTYGSWIWVNDEKGDIYLLNDIYSSDPLRYSGRVTLHMKTERILPLGRNNINYSIVFYQPNHGLIFSIGDPVSKKVEQEAVQLVEESALSRQVSLDGKEYYVAVDHTSNFWAIGLYSTDHMVSASQNVLFTGALFGVICLAAATTAILLMLRPLSRQIFVLTKTMDAISNDDILRQVPVWGDDDISQMAVHFNTMIRRILELVDRVVEEEAQKNRAEFQLLDYRYRNLQMQINPHFIYNALETINALAKISGNYDISEIVQRISRYFRSITVNMDKQFITVKQELLTLKDYVQIYNNIYHKQLTTDVVCGQEMEKALLPTMILQPIVENALVHGLSKVKENPVLTIRIQDAGDSVLQIEVENNGPAITESQCRQCMSKKNGNPGHSGIGLANVIERLNILYGGQASLSIHGSSRGTLVRIEIPLAFSSPIHKNET